MGGYVLDLSAHGDGEQDAEVHQEDGPEDGDVEGAAGCAEQGNQDGLSGGQPELELGQTTDERTELVVAGLSVERASKDAAHEASCGWCGCIGIRSRCRSGQARLALLDILFGQIGFVARIELGCQEGEEEVEQVDEERIADNVPSLRQDDAKHKDEQQRGRGSPSMQWVRGGAIKQRLVSLLEPVGVCEELLDLWWR